METYQDIIETFLAFNGLSVLKGGECVAEALYPFLLMDIEYSVYQKAIAPIKCRMELKRCKSLWRDAYYRFNHAFFLPYSEEQKERIIDLMDEYEKWIMDDVIAAQRVAMDLIVEKVGERPEQELIILSACLLCNCLAQCANIIWSDIHVNSRGEHIQNNDIYSVQKASLSFCDTYMEKIGYGVIINLNGENAFEKAMAAIEKKLANFPPLSKNKRD